MFRYFRCTCGKRYPLLPAWVYRLGLEPKRATAHVLDCPDVRLALWRLAHMKLCRG